MSKGERIGCIAPHRRAEGLYVPENRHLSHVTVRENPAGVKPGQHGGRWSLDDMFALFAQLRERADMPGGVLSGGEQQMLTMCRTLMGDPDLIMVDEPTEGLAPQLVARVRELLETIAERGVAILLIEQKLTIALEISHRSRDGSRPDRFDGTRRAARQRRDSSRVAHVT